VGLGERDVVGGAMVAGLLVGVGLGTVNVGICWIDVVVVELVAVTGAIVTASGSDDVVVGAVVSTTEMGASLPREGSPAMATPRPMPTTASTT
jgi:hypothetical protein